MASPRTLGRYEIRRELGRGVQSVVELAWDGEQEREVAIKTVHYPAAERHQLNPQLLSAATTTVNFRHPHALALYDSGEHNGLPYLVQEYGQGSTLAAQLAQDGPWPPRRTAALLRPVAEALAEAHGLGLVHRNLTPANILITREGQPKVMDFACPPRVDEVADIVQQGLLGTPAYLAPEYIKHKTVDARGDTYAFGLILLEMLSSSPAVQGDSIGQMLHRIMNEERKAPPDLDPALTEIALRCCARAPEQRYAGMAEVAAALEHYLAIAPAPADAAPAADIPPPSVAATLLAQIVSADDALSASLAAINRPAASDQDDVNQLTNAVLQTPSLTDKVVQLANLVYGPTSADGTIGTLSRAVLLLGLDTLRNLAMTVLLADSLQGKPHQQELTETYLRAALAGLLARDLGHRQGVAEADEAFTGALFHSLGELLILLHFPEKTEAIRKLMSGKNLAEADASAQVLGMSYEALGQKAAQSLGFSAAIRYSMHRLPLGAIPLAATAEENLRVIVACAQETSGVIAEGNRASWSDSLPALAERYGENLKLPAERIKALVKKSAEDLAHIAAVLQIDLGQSVFARQLEQFTRDDGAPSPQSSQGPAAANEDHPAAMDQLLSAGSRDIRNSLAENASPNDILAIMLETLYRALGFQRVLLCLKDAKAEKMVARIGFGMDNQALRQGFRFSTAFSPDVFHLALHKGADILVDDTDDPKMADKIPPWFRQSMTAKTFVLFPLVIKGKAVALIYGDKDQAGSIRIPKEQLHRLKDLRDRAASAFRARA